MRLFEITSSTNVKLPDTMYHSTTIENGKEIIKHGLDPTKAFYDEEEEMYHRTNRKGFIFLAWSIPQAEMYSPVDITDPTHPPLPGVLFAVSPPQEITQYMRTDLGEYIRCPVLIPPKYIKVVKFLNNGSFV